MFVKILITILVNAFTVSSQNCDETDSLSFSNLDKVPHFNFDPCVTSLRLTESNIRNFEDGAFENLPNLEELDLSSNQIPPENLFSFGSLPNLRILNLNRQAANTRGRESKITINNPFPNLEILELVEVSAFKVSVENWTALMPNLKELDMSVNRINFSDLIRKFPPKLEKLRLKSNNISFFNLTGYSALKSVDLDSNKFRSLLITDNPRNCQSTGQLCVGWMSSLESLSARMCKIEVFNFHYVSSDPLPKLLELDLSVNIFKTINYLSPAGLVIPKLPSLRRLYLNINQLKSIEILCPFRNVTQLLLNRGRDPSFSFELSEGVDECLTNLRVLDVDNDENSYSLREIPKRFFSKLKKLKELSMANHELTELSGLPTTLERLNVRGNKIEFEKNLRLENLTALLYLNIGANPVVMKINETDGLKKLVNTRHIRLELIY